MAEKSITIFTTAYKPFIGGSEIAIEQISRRLPDIFFNIITPKLRGDLKWEEATGNVKINRVGIGWRPLDKMLFPVLGLLRAGGSPSVVHSYQASYGGGAGWVFKVFHPKSFFILTLQEGKDFEKQGFFINFFRNLIIKKADAITAISNYLADYARKINPKAKIAVIPNGVDLEKFKIQNEKFKIEELKNRLKIEDGDKIVITISRLVEKNGVGDLIEAISKCKIANPEQRIKLMIIGSGSLEENLKIKVQKSKLQDSVLFLGDIPYDEIPAYLAISDVFVRPSFSEGLGNAFLEAMAMGVPIIGTPVGGIPDFLQDGITGLACKVRNPDDIAKKISRILADEGLRRLLGENGRKLVHERYDWDFIAQKFGATYNPLIQNENIKM